MAFRIYSSAYEDSADGLSMIAAGIGETLIFTRTAQYTASGANAHVVSLRRGDTTRIDGALYAGGATVLANNAIGSHDIAIGATGIVGSAEGAAFSIRGDAFGLVNHGAIFGANGIESAAYGTTITNDGTIDGRSAIFVTGGTLDLRNEGAITGTDYGVYLIATGNSQTIENTGTIAGRSGSGIFVKAAGAVQIVNEGTITGRFGVSFDTPVTGDAGPRTLINTGTIAGQRAFSIYGSLDAETVQNDGLLIGTVSLSFGNDRFEGADGRVRGIVMGGGGDDLLIGSARYRNVLDGGDGTDRLIGGDRDDVLIAGAGADYLDGGTGQDVASFRYESSGLVLFMTDAHPDGDIWQSIEGIEGGSGNDILVGDSLANLLYGGAGNDRLSGQLGADTLYGGIGNDTLLVDADDIIVELSGEGIDTAEAYADYTLPGNVENLVLAAGDYGAGNTLANTITGGTGDDLLDGKGGNDVLIGAAGIDRFYFTTAPGAANMDTIQDFAEGEIIQISVAAFPIQKLFTLAQAAFYVGAAAHDADDRIIYNSATRALFFDVDGIGGVAQVQFALLGAGSAVPTYDDFFLGF